MDLKTRIQNLQGHISTMEVQRDQLSMFINEGNVEIENLKQELKEQEKPSYPVGYDPNGEWVIVYYTDLNSYSVVNWDEKYKCTFVLPYRFTTYEQSKKKADGLNALKELKVLELSFMQSESFKADDYFSTTFSILKFCVYVDFNVPDEIVNKLGKDKIKLALEWGL